MPLDQARLDELALGYVARFATSRSKLEQYLRRKLRERGWEGAGSADPGAVAERLASQGYIDDRQFAESKASSLLRRGYGKGRVTAALSQSGIEEDDREGALQRVEEGGWEAALRFAERRRIGPFATTAPDLETRRKAFAAMVRAGHGFDVAQRITSAAPGQVPEPE